MTHKHICPYCDDIVEYNCVCGIPQMICICMECRIASQEEKTETST